MKRLISFEYCCDTDGTDLSVGTFMINGGTTSIYLRYDETVTLNVELTEMTNTEPWPTVIKEYPRAVRLYASSTFIQLLYVIRHRYLARYYFVLEHTDTLNFHPFNRPICVNILFSNTK